MGLSVEARMKRSTASRVIFEIRWNFRIVYADHLDNVPFVTTLSKFEFYVCVACSARCEQAREHMASCCGS
jgi:hypothetical protein